MSTELLHPRNQVETIIETDRKPDEAVGDAPPDCGRCPVCNKPLYPRDRMTGRFTIPPVGAGYESRARCGGCGTILCYMGDGKWRVLTDSDLSEEDLQADRFDRMIGGGE